MMILIQLHQILLRLLFSVLVMFLQQILHVVTDEADNCSVPVVAFVSDVSDNGTCPR